ncbi:MAG: DUF2065 domain-containing protein [Gammaproteobacteria bacterium]|nr:DUF2065 domain-containing protein [Gammaproteobacteria bacterium]
MDWTDFFTALGLMLIFEGVIPFLNPSKWKRALSVVEGLSDFKLRAGGLILMIGGLLLIYFARSLI